MIATVSNCAFLLALANLHVSLSDWRQSEITSQRMIIDTSPTILQINSSLSWNLKAARKSQWWSSKATEPRQIFRSKLDSSSSDSSLDAALLRKSKGFYSRPPEPTVVEISAQSKSEDDIGSEILVPNSIKISLGDDVRLESIRVKELDGLLDLFYSIIDEKKQLISIEDEILAQMNEIRGKVSDSLLPDLDSAIAEKNRIIELERTIFKSISSLASSLAVDIYDSREMIDKAEAAVSLLPEFVDFNMKVVDSDEAITTAQEETQLLQVFLFVYSTASISQQLNCGNICFFFIQMQKSLRSFRYRRDERTLKIIDKFEEVTSRCVLFSSV